MKGYQPKIMLVTGGAGFIGANFIRHILTQWRDVRVINLDLLTYAASLDHLNNLSHPEHYQFVQGDINNTALVKQLLREFEIDTIVHFAAESHVDRSIADPSLFLRTNVMGTGSLLEAARTTWLEERGLSSTQCRFHHISTDEVYGSLTLDAPAFTEVTPYAPNSPYAASKASADHLVRAYHHTYGLPVTTTYCSNNYGPYQHAEKFIPTVIRSCLQGKRIPIYGDGRNIRDWLYVEDHCRGIATVIADGKIGETYNIGGWNEWENIEIVKYICHLLDEMRPQKAPHEDLISFVEDRLGHDRRYAVDATKIKAQLAWEPQEIFETGIRKTVEFYLAC